MNGADEHGPGSCLSALFFYLGSLQSLDLLNDKGKPVKW
jgi:hypothetical protein